MRGARTGPARDARGVVATHGAALIQGRTGRFVRLRVIRGPSIQLGPRSVYAGIT